MNVEWFIVARNNEDPSQPREIIERYYPSQQRGPEETFEKMKGRQSWLRFKEGWQDVRVYQGQKMKMEKDQDDKWTFVLPEVAA
jgi:hypothetical protein